MDDSGNLVRAQHNYGDAQVDGQRRCDLQHRQSDPARTGNAAVAARIYHAFDYPFYLFDIRANAENRVARHPREKRVTAGSDGHGWRP